MVVVVVVVLLTLLCAQVLVPDPRAALTGLISSSHHLLLLLLPKGKHVSLFSLLYIVDSTFFFLSFPVDFSAYLIFGPTFSLVLVFIS